MFSNHNLERFSLPVVESVWECVCMSVCLSVCLSTLKWRCILFSRRLIMRDSNGSRAAYPTVELGCHMHNICYSSIWHRIAIAPMLMTAVLCQYAEHKNCCSIPVPGTTYALLSWETCCMKHYLRSPLPIYNTRINEMFRNILFSRGNA